MDLKSLQFEHERLISKMALLEADIKKLEKHSKTMGYVGVGGLATTVLGMISMIVTGIVTSTNGKETAQATQMALEFAEAGGLQQIKEAIAEMTNYINSNMENASTKVELSITTATSVARNIWDKLFWISTSLAVGGLLPFGIYSTKSINADKKLKKLEKVEKSDLMVKTKDVEKKIAEEKRKALTLGQEKPQPERE